MAKKRGEATMSKSDAVRAAIKAGVDQPTQGVKYGKGQYGIEVTNEQFSRVKSQDKQRGGAAPAKRGRKPKQDPAGSRVGNNSVNPADLARDVKRLVAQYGAAAVKDMAGVFAE